MSGAQTYAYNPSAAQDVVAIFDNNFNQLFPDARPTKASIHPKKKVMKHPIETGGSVVDFWIIEPIEITLPLRLLAATYVDTYYVIKAAFESQDTLLVQTNVTLFDNMIIAEMPHEEDPKFFDTITLNLKLHEVQIVAPSSSSLPPTMTTKAGGNKNGTQATATQEKAAATKVDNGTAAQSIYHYLGGS